MTVLVTGGDGYIGSHVVSQLLGHQRKVVMIDNLSAGDQKQALKGAMRFRGNAGDPELLARVIKNEGVTSVVHMAASIQVEESVRNPTKYYQNNVVVTANLLEAAVRGGVKHFIFSSTAAVYGNPSVSRVSEGAPLNPESPYGRSKVMCEQMLWDVARAHPSFRFVSFRYFNVGGVDTAAGLGYRIEPNPSHLIRKAVAVGAGHEDVLEIFGTDYPTHDGTAVRDYIHVSDVAKAHVYGLSQLENMLPSGVYNLGYGHGYSVLEVVDAVERAIGRTLPIRHAARRPGDSASVIADSTKVKTELQWQPSFEGREGLDHMVRSQLEFERSARRA